MTAETAHMLFWPTSSFFDFTCSLRLELLDGFFFGCLLYLEYRLLLWRAFVLP